MQCLPRYWGEGGFFSSSSLFFLKICVSLSVAAAVMAHCPLQITRRQLDPGIYQELQQVCPECRGSGEVIPERDRCLECRGTTMTTTQLSDENAWAALCHSLLSARSNRPAGKKVVEESKVMEVPIEKGMRWGQKIVMYGEGEQVLLLLLYASLIA
jgi:RecJ-like exonuclease